MYITESAFERLSDLDTKVCVFCDTATNAMSCRDCGEYKGLMSIREWEEYTGEVWDE
jgi:ribosomal protein L40E